MSDNLEKKQNELELADDTVVSEDNTAEIEESTIFSAPAEHNDKAPKAKSGKKKLLSVIAACLAVAILITGTVFIIKYVPVLMDEETPDSSSVFEDITVIETDSKLFNTVTITNKNGEFKFVKQQVSATDSEGKTETKDYWGIEGIDVKKLSTNTMENKITAAANITAMFEIDQKTAEQCGLNNPQIKVKVEAEGKEPYTILVGDESPDGLGSYLKLEESDTIYVVSDVEFSVFEFNLTDLADLTSIPATTFNADTSDNKSADGSYAYFDSLTVSGKLYGDDTITIVNNKADNDSASLMPYLTTTPTERYANSENLSSLISLFSEEVAVNGCYAFDITDETIKEFGLDNPDAVVAMTIEGETKTFKFSKVDDEYSAILYDGATMIRKVSNGTLTFLDYKVEDFYLKNLFLHSINDISELEFENSENDIEFDISYEEDAESNKVYTIMLGDSKIVTTKFQTFYASLVGVQCSDFTIEDVSSKADGAITFVFKDDSESVIEFYRVNDTQYQYSIDGKQMGRITSSAYSKMVTDFANIAKATE